MCSLLFMYSLRFANIKGLTISYCTYCKEISTPGEGLKETNNKDLAEI